MREVFDVKTVFQLSDIQPVNKSHGRKSWLLLTESLAGAKNFALGYNVTEPGGKVPLHAHDCEQEAMYCVSGEGRAILGEEEYPFIPDTVVLAHAGVPHEIRNTGSGPLKFVWVFSPPLQEQK